MTTRKTDVIKKCQLCGKQPKDVYYDAPTAEGPWADMCEDCHQKQPYSQLGTRFELRVKVAGVADVLDGIESSDLEDMLYDNRDIKCPNCGELRSVEPDAAYTYECEGCNSKVRVPCLM